MKWEAIPQDVATLAKGSPLEDSASERVTCAICLNVMVEPVSLVPCGHTFDKKCIQEAMDNKPTGGFTCPKGCQHAVLCYVPNHDLRQLIREVVRIQCPNEGCDAALPLDQLIGHVKQDCPGAKWMCMTMDPLKQTCGAVVAACDRAAHAAECPNVQAKCPHHGCPSRPFRKNMTGHVAKCEHRRTKCRDCGEEFVVKDVKEHREVCTAGAGPCGLCGAKVPRRLMAAHEEDPAFAGRHVKALGKRLEELAEENDRLRRRQEALAAEQVRRVVETAEGRVTIRSEGRMEARWRVALGGAAQHVSPLLLCDGWLLGVQLHEAKGARARGKEGGRRWAVTCLGLGAVTGGAAGGVVVGSKMALKGMTADVVVGVPELGWEGERRAGGKWMEGYVWPEAFEEAAGGNKIVEVLVQVRSIEAVYEY